MKGDDQVQQRSDLGLPDSLDMGMDPGERITLTAKALEEIAQLLESPPAPTDALRALLGRGRPDGGSAYLPRKPQDG